MSFEEEIVLIYHQERPTVFARIESIEPDIKRDWYHVTLLLLTIPPRTVTWLLRGAYIDGEPFTMAGKPVRLEEVKRISDKKGVKKSSGEQGTVIPFKKP